MWFKANVAVMQVTHAAVPITERVALPVMVREFAGATAPVAVAPVSIPVAVPDADIQPTAAMGDELRAQYSQLVAELGIVQPGLLKDEALAFFRDRGTRLYDRAKVAAYLTDQYGPDNHRDEHIDWSNDGQSVMRRVPLPSWGWRPLRPIDAKTKATRGEWTEGTMADRIQREVKPYSKPLPLPVLLTVKEVLGKFQTAAFFVSDEMHETEFPRAVLDPFLLVVIEGERFIIERWDEPAYRE